MPNLSSFSSHVLCVLDYTKCKCIIWVAKAPGVKSCLILPFDSHTISTLSINLLSTPNVSKPCHFSVLSLLLFSPLLLASFPRPKQMPHGLLSSPPLPLCLLVSSQSPHLFCYISSLLTTRLPPLAPLVVPAVLCLASFSGCISFRWKHFQLPVKLLLCFHPLPRLLLVTGSILVSFSSVIYQMALYMLHSGGHGISDIWTETWLVDISYFWFS